MRPESAVVSSHLFPATPRLLERPSLPVSGDLETAFRFTHYHYLEYNCLTMLCLFLLYKEVNQFCVYIYRLSRGPPSPITPASVPSFYAVTGHWTELPARYSRFPLATYFTQGVYTYMSILLSRSVLTNFSLFIFFLETEKLRPCIFPLSLHTNTSVLFGSFSLQERGPFFPMTWKWLRMNFFNSQSLLA